LRKTFAQAIILFIIWLGCVFTVPVVAQSGSLQLTSPAGGEIFYTNRDTLITIRWAGVADTLPVRLEYNTGSLQWYLITDSVRGLSYTWNASGLPPASTYRIRVTEVAPISPADVVIYTGHTGIVKAGAWGPGSDRIVTVANEPHIWDPEVGGSVPLVSLPGTVTPYTDVAWSADSVRIIASTNDAGVISFRTADNSVEATLRHPQPVTKIQLHSNSSRCLTMSADNRIRLFDLPSAAPVRTIPSTTNILDACFDNDGSRVLVCADDARIHPMPGGGAPVVFSGHQLGVLQGEFSNDEKNVATVGGDATVRVWNAYTGTELWQGSDPKEGVRSVAYSPDGTMLAVGMSDSSVTVWDADSGNLLHQFYGIRGSVLHVEWSASGDMIAACGTDNAAHIFWMDGVHPPMRMQHRAAVTSVHWSPNDEQVLTTSVDGSAVVWRVRNKILQGDTCSNFSIAHPPRTVAKLHATGGTAEIGANISVQLQLTAGDFLTLTDIDSLQPRLTYNHTLLHLLSTSIPVALTSQTGNRTMLTLEPVPTPKQPGTFGELLFRATLGTDSITSVRWDDVKQIGDGPEINIETTSDSVYVTGICRAGGLPRLFNPVGLPLSVHLSGAGGNPILTVTVGERGPVTIKIFTVSGNLVWEDFRVLTAHDVATFSCELPEYCKGRILGVVITTATGSLSEIVGAVQ